MKRKQKDDFFVNQHLNEIQVKSYHKEDPTVTIHELDLMRLCLLLPNAINKMTKEPFNSVLEYETVCYNRKTGFVTIKYLGLKKIEII